MIGCNLTVGVRLKPDGTQLEMELGKAGGVLACNPGWGGQQAREEGRGGTRGCKSTSSVRGQGLQGQVYACDPGGGG